MSCLSTSESPSPTPATPPPAALGLPPDYRSRTCLSAPGQPHAVGCEAPQLYALAHHLCELAGLPLIIDLGCGQAAALATLQKKRQILVFGSEPRLRAAAATLPVKRLFPYDFRQPLNIPDELLAQAVVICHRTLGSLPDPQPLMRSLGAMAKVAPYVLVASPDRERVDGVLHRGPPCQTDQIHAWRRAELLHRLGAEGFPTGLSGYTYDNEQQGDKQIALCLGGTHALSEPAPAKQVIALLSCFNDIDIIEACYAHLRAQGVKVAFIDNWSNDGTWEVISRLAAEDPEGCVHAEQFPSGGPLSSYRWQWILRRKAELAQSLEGDWFIHHDSDELRYSPVPGLTLADALGRVDALGFDCIDHTVLDFRPTDGLFERGTSPAKHFRYFEFGRHHWHFKQIKAWKKQAQPVDLDSTGGHIAHFTNQKVFPLKFLLMHYSLRSPAHARRKLHQDRLPRISLERQKLDWHSHVQEQMQNPAHQDYLWRKNTLLHHSPTGFHAEYFIERLSSLGLDRIS